MGAELFLPEQRKNLWESLRTDLRETTCYRKQVVAKVSQVG